jgi:RNA polymerase sigma-70 factor (ECF subfamily)
MAADIITFGKLRANEFAASEDRAAETLHEQVEKAFEDARDDVYRYLLTLGLWPPQAQEATQDVFLKLYVALRQGDRILNTRAWIFRVAHNHGLNVRAREDVMQPFDPDLESSIIQRRNDPEQDAIEGEQMLRLNRAVAGLSEQQRNCLHLRAEGLRYHEIAETIGISVSTVGEFLRRAVTRLKKAVHE